MEEEKQPLTQQKQPKQNQQQQADARQGSPSVGPLGASYSSVTSGGSAERAESPSFYFLHNNRGARSMASDDQQEYPQRGQLQRHHSFTPDERQRARMRPPRPASSSSGVGGGGVGIGMSNGSGPDALPYQYHSEQQQRQQQRAGEEAGQAMQHRHVQVPTSVNHGGSGAEAATSAAVMAAGKYNSGGRNRGAGGRQHRSGSRSSTGSWHAGGAFGAVTAWVRGLFGSSSSRGTHDALRASPGHLAKPRKVPVKIEPKVFFANERTFLAWLHMAVTLASISVAILAFADQNAWSQVYGIIVMPVAICFVVYALYIYIKRAAMIRRRDPGPYEDRVGPIVLTAILMAAIVLNFAVKIYELSTS